jgi:hypothetical protein
VGQWWPVAIIAFGLADMATEHRVTFGQVIITAIGLALLADQQHWGQRHPDLVTAARWHRPGHPARPQPQRPKSNHQLRTGGSPDRESQDHGPR